MKRKGQEDILLYSDDVYEMTGAHDISELRQMAKDYEWTYDDVDTLTDFQILDLAHMELTIYWDFMVERLEHVWEQYAVLEGTAGLWNGPKEGGTVSRVGDLIERAMQEDNRIEWIAETGSIHIEASHHDGTNTWDIRLLSRKGEDYYLANEYNLLRKDLVSHLMHTKGLTKRINL